MSNPCAYTDIEWGVLYKYKNKENIYVICSKDGDANYFCKGSFVKIVLEALQLFDGKHSIEEIIESVSMKYPEFKVDDMIIKVSRSKFIKGNATSNVSSELKRSSINIKEFDISFVRRLKQSWVVFFNVFFFTFNSYGDIYLYIFICSR